MNRGQVVVLVTVRVVGLVTGAEEEGGSSFLLTAATVGDVLEAFRRKYPRYTGPVAVLLNGARVRRGMEESTSVRDGDVVSIVLPVAGG
jgi:molybdopterin converting factor small subunit